MRVACSRHAAVAAASAASDKCVWCGSEGEGATQDPLAVVEGRERASMWICAERRTSPGDADRYFDGYVGVSIAEAMACGVGARGGPRDPRSVECKQVWVC